MVNSHRFWRAWPCLLLISCGSGETSSHRAELQRMADYCTQAMVTSACVVMRGQNASLVPDTASTVFVAGMGEVDAALYRDLRAQGEGMCQHLVAQCRSDWDGSPCRTARRLYGGAAALSFTPLSAQEAGLSLLGV